MTARLTVLRVTLPSQSFANSSPAPASSLTLWATLSAAAVSGSRPDRHARQPHTGAEHLRLNASVSGALRGSEGSNPPPSTGASAANLSSSIRACDGPKTRDTTMSEARTLPLRQLCESTGVSMRNLRLKIAYRSCASSPITRSVVGRNRAPRGIGDQEERQRGEHDLPTHLSFVRMPHRFLDNIVAG
jgi:hypothetical protein